MSPAAAVRPWAEDGREGLPTCRTPLPVGNGRAGRRRRNADEIFRETQRHRDPPMSSGTVPSRRPQMSRVILVAWAALGVALIAIPILTAGSG